MALIYYMKNFYFKKIIFKKKKYIYIYNFVKNSTITSIKLFNIVFNIQ